jgi:hypothetical protein
MGFPQFAYLLVAEAVLYTQDVGGSSPSPPTNLRSFGATARQASKREGCRAEVA